MLFAQLVESVLDEADVRAALAELVALPIEALSEPDDAAGDVEELNGFFRCQALAT